jgi:soluble lytic murein transglycosylase-like protein
MVKLSLKFLPESNVLAKLRYLFFPLLALAVLLIGIGLEHHSHPVPSSGKVVVSSAGELHVLSDTDRQHYRDAFTLSQAKRFREADAALAEVSDGLLKDAFLAGRIQNSDARTHDNALARALKGFSSGYEKSMLHSTAGGHWAAGLASFRAHDMAAAATHFRALLAADNNDLSSDDRAACAFWAYRALLADGDSKTAMQYAEQAAGEAPSFYSILARNVTGQELRSDDTAARLENVKPILQQNAVRRAVAFKETGQDERAEQELRMLFPASNDADRKRLINLATLLDLPAAQMRMALAYAHGDEEANDGLYPMPRWTPTAGYRVEPALLFAIMRQESGFNPNAKSASGAMGVMQLMPATAHAMARGQRISGRSTLPSVSMTLGQSYIENLMETSFIGDNLVFLTAAYNAGPGTVENWQHALHYNNDPLLFVESIPYSETREYVLHVIGNYWVYSRLMGGADGASVAALASGEWPRYGSSDKQLASMLSRLGDGRIE